MDVAMIVLIFACSDVCATLQSVVASMYGCKPSAFHRIWR